jgi:methylenetetrahydrofolate reductase (NADPH)
MKMTDILKATRPVFSFEFYPPKTDQDTLQLYETLKEVKKLQPGFVTITCSAGGGTSHGTIDIVKRTKKELGMESAAHVTCIGHSKNDIKAMLDELSENEIDNVLALRGDPPLNQSSFVTNPNGFHHASELIAFIRASYQFCVGVAGYPEGHIESPNKETDWDYLSMKVTAGADLIITQLFFDNRFFFAFEKRMREKDVTIPIVPGIMPITNYHQLIRFTQTCGASIPTEVARNLERFKNNADAVREYGIEYATRQCIELLDHGVNAIHFYTLNKSHSSREIVKNLRSRLEELGPHP